MTMDKEQQLIQAAFKLFYHNGINATGINRILAESGIAKKTLYHYFSGKEALILATLQYRDQIFYTWLKAQMESAPAGIDALYALFTALDAWFNNRVEEITDFQGCYFINAAAEFSDQTDPIHQKCAAHKQKIQLLIAHHVGIYCAEKEEAELIAEAIGFLKEGAIVQASVLGDLSSANKAKRILSQMLG